MATAQPNRALGSDDDAIVIPLRVPRELATVTASPPELLSQRNVESVCGVSAGQFLAALPAYRSTGGTVISRGKARLVYRVPFVAWLMSPPQPPEDTEHDPAAELAAEIGLEIAGAR